MCTRSTKFKLQEAPWLSFASDSGAARAPFRKVSLSHTFPTFLFVFAPLFLSLVRATCKDLHKTNHAGDDLVCALSFFVWAQWHAICTDTRKSSTATATRFARITTPLQCSSSAHSNGFPSPTPLSLSLPRVGDKFLDFFRSVPVSEAAKFVFRLCSSRTDRNACGEKGKQESTRKLH